MNVIVVGKNKGVLAPLLASNGFVVVEHDPDFVISCGGDGTFMKAEELHPGIPKIMLKDSLICKKCSLLPNEAILEKVAKGEYDIEEMPKLRASVEGHELEAINDIVVHNKDPRHAIRYHVSLNGKRIHHMIIGDGIVVATPFGSTGYYNSITGSSFEVGFGLAFNNSTERSDHSILNEDSILELEVMRGPAIAYADNQEMIVDLETGGQVRIEKSANVAQIVVPRI